MQFLATKLSGEVQKRPKLMCKKVRKQMCLKRDVCQHLAAIKAGKRHYVYKFMIQNIVFCIQKDVYQLFVEFKPKAAKCEL